MTQPLHSRRPLSAVPARPAHPGRPEPERRHLTLVERQASRLTSPTTRTRLLLAGAAAGAVAIAFVLVYLHVVMAQRQFRLDSLSARVATQQASYSRLRLQVAQLESPQRIIATAEGTLGMRQPASVTYLSPASPVPVGGSLAGAAGVAGGSVAPPAGAGPAASRTGPVPAPAGDADWPQIKSQLAGSP